MMSALEYSSFILLVLSFIAITVFIARYLFTRWEASEEGKHMMTFSLVIFAILGTTLAGTFVREPTVWWYLLETVEMGALLFVLVWRDRLLFRAQAIKKAARLERAKAALLGLPVDGEDMSENEKAPKVRPDTGVSDDDQDTSWNMSGAVGTSTPDENARREDQK